MSAAVGTAARAGGSRAEAVLDIEGMTCASCVARVEKRLQRLDGVEASVNLATESARIDYPADLDADALVAAVREAGYEASVRRAPASRDAAPSGPELSDAAPLDDEAAATETPAPARASARFAGATLRTRLLVSAVLAVPVVALGMVPA